MKRLFTRVLVLGLILASAMGATPAFAQPTAPNEPALWRDLVVALEPGAVIALRLKDGSRRQGTVLHVGENTFTFKARTRIPVAARDIAFTDVATLERHKPSMSPAKKVLLGVGVGAGVWFVVTALFVAAIGD